MSDSPETRTCLGYVVSESVPEPLDLPADDPRHARRPSSVFTMQFEVLPGTDATPEDVAEQAAWAFSYWRQFRAQDGTVLRRPALAELADEREKAERERAERPE